LNLRAVLRHAWAKPLLWGFLLLPFAFLVLGIFQQDLGPNPAEYLIRSTGELALRMLCLTLLITPLRVQLSLPELAQFRRGLGLLTFFYAFMHALCYSLLDMEWAWDDIVKDIWKRPFILVGVLSFVLLSLLAGTSFNRAVKAMGAHRWRQLHQAVYVIAGLAILHFFWMRSGKKNYDDVMVYAAILGLLLGWRLWRKWQTWQAAKIKP
jgi:methionine sulfoxide reductase heme-binding subunit